MPRINRGSNDFTRQLSRPDLAPLLIAAAPCLAINGVAAASSSPAITARSYEPGGMSHEDAERRRLERIHRMAQERRQYDTIRYAQSEELLAALDSQQDGFYTFR